MDNTGLNEKQTVSLAEINEAANVEFENFTELTEVIKLAKEKKASPETLGNLEEAFTKILISAQEAAVTAARAKETEDEADRFTDLESKGIKEIFDNSSDEQKKLIAKTLEKEYGGYALDLSFNGGSIQKMLQAPMSRNDASYEDMTYAKHAHDMVLAAMAMNGDTQGLNLPKSSGDRKFNKAAYARFIKQMAEQGDDPKLARGARVLMQTYEKTLGDAMDSLTATDGLETIPEELSSNAIEELFLTRAVPALFKRNFMPAPTWTRPRITSMGRGYLRNQATTPANFLEDLTTTDPFQTDETTWTAKEIAHSVFFSNILMEDSVLDMAARCLQDSKDGIMNAVEDAVINGKIAADLDGALWSHALDARRAWDGIRASVNLANQGLDLGTFNLDNYTLLRKLGGKWMMNVSELVNIVSPSTYFNMLMMDEFLTVDKFPNAVNVTGTLGAIQGIPIVASEYVYENLNASGVYDGSTTDNTLLIIARRDAFEFGDRRQMVVERDYSVLAGQHVAVASWRGDFQAVRDDRPEVVIGYNVDV